ncbi:DDE-type integrase/transposase/recombinase [Nostoc edaphicum CCNP1411]|uniref:DDE-type integrase/transposase/recombinase n=1 Tax=Nostoc edaphicum CCNP1411 TaxID=1472755 RepID=A0A7D7QN68_9NOSO|nr:DDE-type integrase/transposase/recombinase [Nostoc edaphicum]QMS92341.1 DDE-type integrase/transposase/recombinase [Nostoc edaphicum CCNP1411]
MCYGFRNAPKSSDGALAYGITHPTQIFSEIKYDSYRTIQFESHTVELRAIELFYEYDDDVIEYWDQAFQFTLKFASANGKNGTYRHIPDFLVIRQNSVSFEEWKPEKTLEKLVVKQPNRYCRGENGQWHSPPAEEYAQKLGLYYRLRSDIEIDNIKYRNIQYLKGYLNKNYVVNQEIADTVITIVASNPGITFVQLRQKASNATIDDINALIATQNIYIDLSSSPLMEQERVYIFRDKVTAESYAIAISSRSNKVTDSLQIIDFQVGISIIWDGNSYTIHEVGEAKIWLRGENGLLWLTHTEFHKLVEAQEIKGLPSLPEPSISSEGWQHFLKASPTALEKANERYQLIVPHLYGEDPEEATKSERTIRYWKANFKKAKDKYGCGLIGLIDQRKGNSTPRYSDQIWEFIDKIIEDNYETFKQKNVWAVYEQLKDQWKEKGIIEPLPSHTTFYERVKQGSGYYRTKKRLGSRAANQKLAPLLLYSSTPRHGDRPLEIVHIDHTLLDIEAVCLYTGINLGRPWITAMLDAYSRRTLAAYLTFDHPSYRSCMMVLRICVQRFGRFPETIVVDNGKEFKSVYFDTLLARFECTKKHRPPNMPKFSSIVERWFGSSNKQFINELRGNTQVTKHVRLVNKANNPKNLAVWTLDELYDYFINGYCYGAYDRKEHPALEGFSPYDSFHAGLAHSGSRAHQKIIYDDQFRILTLPSTLKGTAKVQPSTGVRINQQDYWSIDDSFLRPDIEGQQVPVRYDPFDYGTAYAYVHGHWVRCISNHYNKFQGHSQREIMVATEILRQKKHLFKQKATSKPGEIAQLLKNADQYEELKLQSQRDLAAKDVRNLIENKSSTQTFSPEKTKLEIPANLLDEGSNNTEISLNNDVELNKITPYANEDLW